ncbi:ATP-binding protein [Hydrogenophaga sp. T2]|uniref:sensor histidine kinase n=1 Tax=Hydrogenophaga sp. T2 TaxID=3132823 RepID=UPI003CEBB68B
MRRRLSLTQRLSALVALLLIVCGAASMALQMRAGDLQAQEAIQRLSLNLARQIADNNQRVLSPDGFDANAVNGLFGMLMQVNPSVEVYLLHADGRIAAHAAAPGRLRRERVDVQPLQALWDGARLPVLGDDPRSAQARKVFSAAPLISDGRVHGWVYVVLIGEAHENLVRELIGDGVLRATLWSMLLVIALGLVTAFIALRWITRPLRELTADVRGFETKDGGAVPPQPIPTGEGPPHDDIHQLRHAFSQMTRRIVEQWQALSLRDQERREMVANISHDLRTPLTSLHGYLETLRLKDDTLSPADRRRYLDIALGQSRKVGTLAQSLFELARLEHGGIKPNRETFSITELVQDVFQKFELAAEARQQRLVADLADSLPRVQADLGMIERVLTNLLHNAIQHSPAGGVITVRLRHHHQAVEVTVLDQGPGVPEGLRAVLFTRPAARDGWRYGPEVAGGLGLLIVRRILQLHGSDIALDDGEGGGATFRFLLAVN